MWLLPAAALGLGLLAKGPLHLVFFYAVVLGVLGAAREWRLLAHPAHFVSLAIVGAIFAAWAVPYLSTEAAREAVDVWKAQSVGRVTGHFDLAGWLTNIPRALLDQLPWIFFAPLLWRKDLSSLGARTSAMFLGARRGVVLCFLGFLVIPGALPRYTLPLLAPFACLLAISVADPRLPSQRRALSLWSRVNSSLGLALACLALAILVMAGVAARPAFFGELVPSVSLVVVCLASALAAGGAWFWGSRLTQPLRLALTSTALIAVGMNLFVTAGIPLMNRSGTLRPAALEIARLVPQGVPLCIIDSDYLPVLFYLNRPLIYAPSQKLVARPGTWVLTCHDRLKKFLPEHPEFRLIRDFPRVKPCHLALLQSEEGS
jgi:4-amino-4-deoxy-L-arabinose transferase-like glycosyltransferase